VDEPRFPQVVLTVSADEVDEASRLLFELAAEGIEERDDATLVVGERRGEVTLVASFSDSAAARAAVDDLPPEWAPLFHEIVGDAWRDAYKAHFHPFRLSEHVTIRPPWESHAPGHSGEIVLELEPGRAFGTGLHPTTSGVARALDERQSLVRGASVLDVGTGSGILLIACAAFGAKVARGIDIDTDAVACAMENARRNGFEACVSVDTTPIEEVSETYDLVLANIEARVLLPMAPHLVPRLREGGLLILSGILDGQEGEVRNAYPHFVLDETRREGEWIVLILRR
jgi:ribosomal protein L11 methyltransferase